MSKYTTEVRFICENYAGLIESKGYNDIDSILDEAAPKIFNFDFPIFDEAYRLPLEKKILKHFYTREISEETVGLWKLRLDDKMNIIMPYFNKLYESELIKFDPLRDTDIHTTHAGGESGEATNEHNYVQKTDTTKTGVEGYNEVTKNSDKEKGSGTVVNDVSGTQSDSSNRSENNVNTTENNVSSNSKGKENNTNLNGSTNYDLYSDTPQGGLSGVDSENYLTNARKVNNNEESIGESVNSNETNESSSSTQNNISNVNDKSDRKTSSQSNTINQDSRDREQDGSRTGDRQNIENAKTDYSNVGTGGNKFNNTNQYIENIFGKRGYGSYSKMLIEFRETFLNIDAMILDALEPLFFGLW